MNLSGIDVSNHHRVGLHDENTNFCWYVVNWELNPNAAQLILSLKETEITAP